MKHLWKALAPAWRWLTSTTMLKTFSWALLSGVIITAGTFIGTWDICASLVGAVIAVTMKTPFYTLHEALWNRWTGHHKVHLPEGTVDEPDDEPDARLAA